MKTRQLIDLLTADLKPVRPALDPRLAAALWVVGCGFITVLALTVRLGFRADLGAASLNGEFFATCLALAALAVVAAQASLNVAIPGRRFGGGRRAWLVGLGLAVAASFLAYAPATVEPMAAGLAASGLSCSAMVLGFAVVPAVALFFWLRRLAPMAPVRAGAIAGLASGALGCLGVGLHCASVHPVHLLVYHGLPILVLATFAGILGGRFLRW